MTPIVTQVLVKKKTQSPMRREWIKTPPASNDAELYRKDVAGFLIFLLAVFTVVMISLHA
ncbi:hypothetical protein LMORI2_05850 [Limnohabitans sp. MORI2]|jgi:hypothetical protein|uniref:hypothetical protein n=1 Tax=Limnohabitans sp. MORI2 TaxID=1751150 RepID=UPI0023777FDE|nr:hypothetical protein [Limnohabitans sp. MORI2]BDU57603.1 hypothetical protein LMORI2_05850 [Limnohabitans sp. MORI2]